MIEDTVFPPMLVASKEKSVPSDFSHLKDVIEPANDKDNCSREKLNVMNNQTSKQQEGSNPPSSETKQWSR